MLTKILPNAHLLFPYENEVNHLASSLIEGLGSIFHEIDEFSQEAFFALDEVETSPTKIATTRFDTISDEAKPLGTFAESNSFWQDLFECYEEVLYDGVAPEVVPQTVVLPFVTPVMAVSEPPKKTGVNGSNSGSGSDIEVVATIGAVATANLAIDERDERFSFTSNASNGNYWDSTFNWFAANHDPIFGMNYWTRAPQNIFSILSNLHKVLPLEVAGSFAGIAGVGGVLDTYVVGKRMANTATALYNSKKTKDRFANAQHALQEKMTAAPQEGIDNVAKQAWASRAALHKLEEANKHTAEHMIDGVRYTLAAWTARTFFAVRMFVHTVTWLARASGILGVVAGGLQMISGLLKWRSAQKASSLVKKALEKLDALSTLQRAGETEIKRDLISHIRVKRENVLHKAREKRLRAKWEAASGVTTLVLGGLSFAFPPLVFGVITVGLIYAGFRIYKGIQLYYSNKQQNQQKLAWRTEIEELKPDATAAEKLLLVENNPYYAVRYLVESIYQDQVQGDQNNLSWLKDFLENLGIPEADIKAVYLMARNEADMPDVCKALEDMFFSEAWFMEASV